MNNLKKYLLTALIFVIALMAIYAWSGHASKSGPKVVIYKSPTCGCCVQYADYLEARGYDVKVISTENMELIHERYGIPDDMESCHTAIFGDYAVEGHIPLEAVNDLLAKKPDLDAIALPGMPAGSPGMPGIKSGDFQVYGIKSGQASVFGNY